MALYSPNTSNPVWSWEDRIDDEQSTIYDISLNITEAMANHQTAAENVQNYRALVKMIESLYTDMKNKLEFNESILSLLEKDLIVEEYDGVDRTYKYSSRRLEA